MTDQQKREVQDAQEVQVNVQQVYNEPMDLDEMVCRSLCSIENPELRKRLANLIILVGGPCRTNKMIEVFEQTIISKMHAQFD